MSNEITAQTGFPSQATWDGLPPGYADLLTDIKAEIRETQIRVRRIANTELVCHYWRLGRLIVARQEREGWGAKVVDRLSADLRASFPEQRGLSRRSLMYMQKAARCWPDEIVQQPAAQLPWGHIMVLLDALDDRPTRDFYAAEAVQHGWSRSFLSNMIAGKLHLRQGMALSKAQPAHLGQLAFYTAVVDDKIRDLSRDDATLGILIAADRNSDVVQYSLRGSTQPMAVSSYATLPPEMRALLPTEADLTRVTHEVLDARR